MRRNGPASAGYETAADVTEVLRHLEAVGARTVIVDIEPFITHWASGHNDLGTRLAAALSQLGSLEPAPLAVAFSTNSRRRPARLPVADGVEVQYIAGAAKPLRLSFYRNLPLPGAVVGDQVATDGILAARLGYSFIHYKPTGLPTPIGPRLMRLLGYPFHRFYFKRS